MQELYLFLLLSLSSSTEVCVYINVFVCRADDNGAAFFVEEVEEDEWSPDLATSPIPSSSQWEFKVGLTLLLTLFSPSTFSLFIVSFLVFQIFLSLSLPSIFFFSILPPLASDALCEICFSNLF